MKALIIYNSKTGFTKRYAEWIASETNVECVTLKQVKRKKFDEYDIIVFGGFACAGSISKIAWFKSHLKKWSDKHLIVFCVGGSTIESPELARILDKCFNEKLREIVKVFYCPGGINYEKMSFGSRMLLKMFRAFCNAKKHKTEEEIEMVKMLSASYDISDKKYSEPIVKYINALTEKK